MPLMVEIDEHLGVERSGSIASPVVLSDATGPVMRRRAQVVGISAHGRNAFLFVDLVLSAAAFSSSARFFRSAASRAGASR